MACLHERLAAAVAKERQRGESKAVLAAIRVRAGPASERPLDARLFVAILFDGLVLDSIQALLIAATHDRQPPFLQRERDTLAARGRRSLVSFTHLLLRRSRLADLQTGTH